MLTSLAAILTSGTLLFLDAPAADSKRVPPNYEFEKMPHRNTLVDNVTFVAFDTETTGFSPAGDRIVEIGAVKFRNGEIIEEKSWLINPGRWIPPWVIEVHGITNEDVADKPSFKQVYPEFVDFVQGSVLMAHNARFDVSFMAAEIRRSELPLLNNLVVDSLPLFRRWFPSAKSYTLSDVAHYTKVDTGVLHRALADTVYMVLIFEKGLSKRSASLRLGELYRESGGAMSF
ncbi:MAG TPA: 3'-5' exonuclease [Kiritimatiellia bacterium]|nr:3'-5' exonuclease [Kiritimatiellia bacterium]HRZ11930.1 3'-5' exonuclease [Kiritimatiellia bacterium]HSA17264.1 3'-5' exonuclease [Kiritimatiellia bacterium]